MAKLTALRIAHQIADRLAARGLHGRFTVGFPGDDDWGYRGWHEYRAVLRNQHLTVDQIHKLADPFTLLAQHYGHRVSIRIRFEVENDDGEAVAGEWRSISRTRNIDALNPRYLRSRTRRLSVEGVQSSTYLAVDGISVLVEPTASHD